MPTTDLVDAFVQVFRGRADVYGNAKGFAVKEALTRAVFERHLTSPNPADWIGVYCMLGEQCSWGCIDIDGKDFALDGWDGETKDARWWDWPLMLDLATKLQSVLRYAPGGEIRSYIERTKNGYHVWVFPEQPLVPARVMRRALMAACKAIGYDPNEVNPKAEGPRAGTKGYGNFVRLPYGGYLSGSWSPTARFMLDGLRNFHWLEEFLADVQRVPTANLEAAAALWTPPPVAHHEVDMDAGLDAEPLIRLCDGLAWTIWKDGPLPGKDRSSTLAHLAHLVRERGLTATQAFAIVKSADARWGGKFASRADGEEQMARIVENAYG